MTQSCVEITNEHGFTDYVLQENGVTIIENGRYIEVCPQCMCYVRQNRGQGCACDKCNLEFEIECEHDMGMC